MAGKKNIIGSKGSWSPAVLLVILFLSGCGPKRVVRTEAPVEPASVAQPDAGPEQAPAAGTSETIPPDGSRLGFEAAALAKEQLGKQYQWGAAGPDKFDCSGLVMFVYDSLGVQLPRVTSEQAYAGVHVDRKDLQPGDLVFFKINGSRIDHVGIYLGRSRFVHAPRRYMPVRTDSLNDSYWSRRFKGGRRLG